MASDSVAGEGHTVSEKELEACIFDCDGTLVDSMPLYFKTWELTCEFFGLSFTKVEFYKFAGTPVNDIIQFILNKGIFSGERAPTLEEVVLKKREFGEKVKATGLKAKAIECVVDIVKYYHNRGIPLGVASSGWKDHVYESLTQNDLLKYFKVIVTADDMSKDSKPKPAPDIFLEVAKQLCVNPIKCKGFEDADLGIQSLKSAGMEPIDVRLLNGYPLDTD